MVDIPKWTALPGFLPVENERENKRTGQNYRIERPDKEIEKIN